MERKLEHSPQKRKIPGLDGLRGIAILGVIGYHLAPGIFPGGFLGVNLFFVLSGYLMAVTSCRAQQETGFHALTFYGRRAGRIYPALMLCVCATLCAAWLLAPDVLTGVREEILSIFAGRNNWWQITQNASYFTKITGTSPFTHLWSLAIEMQFYLIWPLLFWGYNALNRHSKAGVIGWSLLIAASTLALLLNFHPGDDPSRIYYGSDTRLFALLIGSLVGLKTRHKRLRPQASLYAGAFLAFLAIQFLLFFIADGQRPETYWLLLFPSAWIGAALIHLCADHRFSFGHLLDHLPLSWLGMRSYELYLVQYPIIFFVQRTQPVQSQGVNSFIALLLILLVGNWMYWIVLRTRIWVKRRKQSSNEKTPAENQLSNLVCIDCCCDGRRYPGLSHCPRSKYQR